LVLGFRSSSNLASAYGVAVTATMVITTLLAYFVTRRIWGWGAWRAVAVTGAFLLIDLTFFGANIIKVAQGGWLPLLIAVLILVVMTTWERGGELLAAGAGRSLPIESLIADVERGSVARVPGIAVFLSGDATRIPTALMHNLKHNRVLHKQNVFLTVQNEEVPYVPEDERVRVEELGPSFHRIVARYGFMEDPDIPKVLKDARGRGLEIDRGIPTYVLSRNVVLPAKEPSIARWRERLYILLLRNSVRPTQFFRIPPNQVVELGRQVSM
jgi:KUP system potassium uptake protein